MQYRLVLVTVLLLFAFHVNSSSLNPSSSSVSSSLSSSHSSSQSSGSLSTQKSHLRSVPKASTSFSSSSSSPSSSSSLSSSASSLSASSSSSSPSSSSSSAPSASSSSLSSHSSHSSSSRSSASRSSSSQSSSHSSHSSSSSESSRHSESSSAPSLSLPSLSLNLGSLSGSAFQTVSNSASPQSMMADPADIGPDGLPVNKNKNKIMIVANDNELSDRTKAEGTAPQQNAMMKEEEQLKQRTKAEEQLRKKAFHEELKKKDRTAEDQVKTAQEHRRKANIKASLQEQMVKAQVQIAANQEARKKDNQAKQADSAREQSTKVQEMKVKRQMKKDEMDHEFQQQQVNVQLQAIHNGLPPPSIPPPAAHAAHAASSSSGGSLQASMSSLASSLSSNPALSAAISEASHSLTSALASLTANSASSHGSSAASHSAFSSASHHSSSSSQHSLAGFHNPLALLPKTPLVEKAKAAIRKANAHIEHLRQAMRNATSPEQVQLIKAKISQIVKTKMQAAHQLQKSLPPRPLDPQEVLARQQENERRIAEELSPFKNFVNPRIGSFPVSIDTFETGFRSRKGANQQAANKFCMFMGHARAANHTIDLSGMLVERGSMRFHETGLKPDHCSDCTAVFSFIRCLKTETNQKAFLAPKIQDKPVASSVWEWNGKDEFAGAMVAARLFCQEKHLAGVVRFAIDRTSAIEGAYRFRRNGAGEVCAACRSSFRYVICRKTPACKKPRRDPVSQPGQFVVVPFHYPTNWSFTQQWTFNSSATIVGDFNGDHKTDYARLGPTYMHLFISKGDGTFYLPIYPFPTTFHFEPTERAWTSLKSLDINGDGRSDILRTSPVMNHGFIAKGTNSECWHRNGWIPISCFAISTFHYPGGWSFSDHWRWWGTKNTIQGDFNGDGKSDFGRVGPSYIHFFISRGNGLFWYPIFPFSKTLHFTNNEFEWTTITADLNGDCATDVVRVSPDFGVSFVSQLNEKCWQTNGWMEWSCMQAVPFTYKNHWHFVNQWNFNAPSTLVGDYNGDGYDDFIRLGAQKVRMFISKGDGTFYMPEYPFPVGWDYKFDERVWATLPANDYDGDGRTDILRSFPQFNHAYFPRGADSACFYHDGPISAACFNLTTFKYPPGMAFQDGWSFSNHRAIITGDFNGDGNGDFANLGGATANEQFFSRSG